jgi:diadenosine tetraphosphate (Ap4A) HIT family hydrolase
MKLFGVIDPERILADDELFMVVLDKYPISPGHSLIIIKSAKSRFTDLTKQEQDALMNWMNWTVQYLDQTLSPKPDGFNLGLNDGEAAGQTISQLHFHVIPRFKGNCLDTRGGVREIMPQKAKY